jgi:hypothetical protein
MHSRRFKTFQDTRIQDISRRFKTIHVKTYMYHTVSIFKVEAVIMHRVSKILKIFSTYTRPASANPHQHHLAKVKAHSNVSCVFSPLPAFITLLMCITPAGPMMHFMRLSASMHSLFVNTHGGTSSSVGAVHNFGCIPSCWHALTTESLYVRLTDLPNDVSPE